MVTIYLNFEPKTEVRKGRENETKRGNLAKTPSIQEENHCQRNRNTKWHNQSGFQGNEAKNFKDTLSQINDTKNYLAEHKQLD